VSAPARVLRGAGFELALGERPLLMGIVNASPDSFSDGGVHATLDEQAAHARELVAAGADIIDVGGESATTGRPPVAEGEEARRVVGLVERIAGELGVIVSIETYKPAVARAAVAAGAGIVNDVSGLRDPALADVCAQTGAALVIMHTAAAPRQRRQDPELYTDVGAEVLAFLRERMALAESHGVAPEQLILDPGPDFAKTPAQTVAVMSELAALHELDRPLLIAVSRKDFIGAITGRPPRQRLAGTLAALAHGVQQGGHIFRVHDVAEAAEFLTVRSALRGELELPADLALAEPLRREPAADAGGRREER
jgi:dihydropteroate synthase